MFTPHPLRKIIRPNLSPIIVHREPLINALNNALAIDPSSRQTNSYKLVLLCAPMGYGKTTLLTDFSHHTHIPCCWYFLDSSDMDKITFLKLLIASIQQHFPAFGSSLDVHLANSIAMNNAGNPIDLHPFEIFIDAIVTEIEATITERIALLLCNYHEINTSQEINALVNYLLLHLPPQCVIIIESRAIPALELAPLITYRQLLGLGSSFLRFTAQDIRALSYLLQHKSFSEEEAERLSTLFDGWIAGILLGTRLGNIQLLSPHTHSNTDGHTFTTLLDQHDLFAYLVDEVFKREPAVYLFLKETSILEQMTSKFCNTLLSISDADARLAYVEQQGLFVTRSGDDSQLTYTCHPVLRELLCAELQKQNVERFIDLHRRAAELFYATKDYDQAITHALTAGTNDFAAKLIIQITKSMLQQGHSETLARWIDALPSTTLRTNAQLLLARAHTHLMKYETAQAIPLLDQAYALTICEPPIIDSDIWQNIQAEILVVRSIAFFDAGNYLQAQQVCQQALTLVSVDAWELRAIAYQRLGACACLLGDCMTGIAQMQQALHLWGHSMETRQAALLHGSLANAYNMIGNYALSEHHRTRAIQICDHLGDTWGKINNLIGMGTVKQYKGALAEAETILMQALTMAREVHFQIGEAYALLNLGELHQDQGLYNKALAFTEDGLSLASQLKDNYLMNSTLCILATTYLLMGDAHTAILLLGKTCIPDDDTTSYIWTLRELTQGIIFFFQKNYKQGYARLAAVETAIRYANLKRLHIKALIYLAACQQDQEQTEAAIDYIEKVVELITQGDYEHIALIELRRLPELWRLVQTMPLRTQLASCGNEQNPSLDTGDKPQTDFSLIKPGKNSLQIRTLALGEPMVMVNDIPITRWRMAKSMELYFFLLNIGRPVHKEQIIVTLWPDADDHIDQTLRSTIYYLRKALGEPCIVYRSGTYVLDLASLYETQFSYDVATFQEQYAYAKNAIAVKDEISAENAFRDMITLYRGDYTQSFYSDWCIRPRDELRRTYLDVRHQLALITWNQERFDESIIHWQQILAVDSCQEDAHYGLIRCYLRQGKRGLALRQYQRCVDTLREDLSVSPGPALQRLYDRITGKR